MNANNQTARLAGVLYLCIIIFGIFAQFGVRDTLIVTGDAGATAANILASETLFRIGFMSDLLQTLSYLLTGYVLYAIFKAVNQHLASLIVLFVIASAPVMFLNMLNQFAALVILDGGDYLSVFNTEQLQSMSLLFLNLHNYGYLIPGIFFGLWLLPIGLLIIQSGYMPKFVGVLLIVACIAHLITFFASFLLPEHIDTVRALAAVPTIVPEFLLCGWLLIRGVNVGAETSPAKL